MTQTTLAKDRFNHAIQALRPGAVQNISFTTSGSTKTGADIGSNTVVVRLVATADCYVAIGPDATVAADTSSMFLPASAVEYFRVSQAAGWRVAARGVSATGTLNVTEMT